MFPGALSAAPGDWPEPRQNAHLTGFQPQAGRIRQPPKELAVIDLGRENASLIPVTKPDGSRVGLHIAAGALECWDESGKRLWKTHPVGLNFTQFAAAEDLDGDGHLEAILQAGRPAYPYGAAVMVSLRDGRLLWRYDVEPISYEWHLYTGHYLPGAKKPQIVVLMQGYPPDEGFGFIALFAFERRGTPPTQRWRYDFDRYTCFPGLFKVDIDGDGIEEMAVETHSHMWFLDPLTGKPKQYLDWDVSPANVRSYGLARFLDVNGDGRKDFVVIANFAQHHEVLLNRNGKFVPAWHHGWAENVTTGKVETTWPEPPIADLDGDGQLEMTLSMYNSENERAWLVRVYDAVSGRLKYRLPGMVAAGVFDLEGDGRAEILANATADPIRTRLDGAHILKVKDGKLVSVWSDPAAIAVKCRIDTPDDHVPRWSDNQPEAASVGGPIPLIRRPASPQSPAQTLYRIAKKEQAGTEPGSIFLADLDGQALAGLPWQPGGQAPPFRNAPQVVSQQFHELLAADLDGDGCNELMAWVPSRCRIYKMRKDRMEEIGGYDSDALPAIADFDGDGVSEIAVVRIDPNGTPLVEVLAPTRKGRTLWRSQLPPPGHLTLAWSSRPAYLRAGRFTGRKGMDLYLFAGVPVVRSLVLDGATGRTVWEKSEMPDLQRYWGPTMNLAAACDTDSDGKDELIFTNPDYYCVADGSTGNLILGPLAPPTIFHQPSMGLYTMPVILDAAGKSRKVCLVGGHYFQAAMSAAGKPVWHVLPPAGDARCAREGFMLLRDGRWVMGFGRQNGQFACIDVGSGKLRWELPVRAACTDVAACDIDGDRANEFIFGTSHGDLYAVADAGDRPRVLWRKRLGSPARFLLGSYADYGNALAGRPVVADLNRDGLSEIIIQTADGRIRILGAK
ncbi:MAG: VCBS repeat-containing protein [Armatimonadetes bacterium]|nr:VCBS repeat-containing protein [Armatimonadota bacterium]